jgi:hypothetical protein
MAKHDEASRGNRWVRLKGSSTLAKFRLIMQLKYFRFLYLLL